MALVRTCPKCGTENPDEGQLLSKCSNYADPACGYCRHAGVTRNKCDYCGLEDPPFVEIDLVQGMAHEAS